MYYISNGGGNDPGLSQRWCCTLIAFSVQGSIDSLLSSRSIAVETGETHDHFILTWGTPNAPRRSHPLRRRVEYQHRRGQTE